MTLLRALLFCALATAMQGETPRKGPSVDLSHGALKVSADGRFLTHADGAHFLYLADTAWELFHRLNTSEAEQYLEDRRQKGFTVVQAVLLAELDGLTVPNPNGDLPLIDKDPTRPNEPYFRHVDHIVAIAAKKGIYIGMLPAWVRWVGWDTTRVLTPQNGRAYGAWLGKRYAKTPNLIWILGGDMLVERQQDMDTWRAVAAGIRSGDTGKHLMTYHPRGYKSSSQWYHNEPWLDFNMIQSGHGRKNIANYNMIAHDAYLTPVKPTLDAEPAYENHPVGWKPENGWFDDQDVRQAAWWAMLGGAAGHTYGCHDIWQMRAPGRQPVSAARGNWYDSLQLPGAWDMLHLRTFIESRAWTQYAPDLSVLLEPRVGAEHVQASRSSHEIVAYLPAGGSVSIQMGLISGSKVRARWYNPRTGATQPGGEYENKGSFEFKAPGVSARGNDWVLTIQDLAVRAAPEQSGSD